MNKAVEKTGLYYLVDKSKKYAILITSVVNKGLEVFRP